MSFSTEPKLWQLKQDAKWGRDIETQKRAIQELARIGSPAEGILEEIMMVSSRDDIKEYCRGVIDGFRNMQIGETEKNQPEKNQPEKKAEEKQEISQEKSAMVESK